MMQPPRSAHVPELLTQMFLDRLGAEILDGSGFESEPPDIDPEQESGDDRDH